VKFEGFVKKITTRTGHGPRGNAWTAYSAKMEGEDGKEFDQWIGLGFEAPPFKEGDYVQLQTTTEKGREQLVKGSIKVKKNAPARASAAQPSKGPDQAPSASGPSNAERQTSITYQSSRKDAIEIVKLLLANDALPMSTAKGKAATASRFDEITLAIEKLTVELTNDVNTQRVMQRVADAGVVKADKKAKNDLPEDADGDETPDSDPSNGDDDNWEEQE
jgi:hypothetical protein